MISPDDIKVEIIDPDGEGGQKVYPRPMNLKATHLPTGLIAIVNTGRMHSQHIALEIAIDMLLTALTHPRFRP